MRTTCRVLAGIAIVVGILLIAHTVLGRARGPESEMAAFVGSMLFGSGLLSLTILVCAEPRWPDDRPSRRPGEKRYLDDDPYP